MTLDELLLAIKSELRSRPLKDPRIRLNALQKIVDILLKAYPDIQSNPDQLLDLPRREVESTLARFKTNGRLNGAEKSVLNNVYQVLDGKMAPRGRNLSPLPKSGGLSAKTHKLEPIAEAVAGMLAREFGIPATFECEVSMCKVIPAPSPEALREIWPDIKRVYGLLTDGQYSLDERIKTYPGCLHWGAQAFDVWYGSPYHFALEYDEGQHFNQFRLMTIEEISLYRGLPMDCIGYVRECRRNISRPGISGFTRLRSLDPLFPPALPGDKQDNRVRQRAFRDMLKDVAHLLRTNMNPTIRVGSYVLGGKRNGFTGADCLCVCDFLRSSGTLDRLGLPPRILPSVLPADDLRKNPAD